MQEVGQVAGQEVGSEARARHVPTHDRNYKLLIYFDLICYNNFEK
jgi:hypothetical protein